ncbi:hypothetical protein HRbin04_01255 [archaeon HR04]|nr:hypothetical protein HRbin04_01255 [archaeon HR04]
MLRNALSVLPEPVGLATRVLFPWSMLGIEYFCGGVNDLNLFLTHSLTTLSSIPITSSSL